jgi:hypothetical protein
MAAPAAPTKLDFAGGISDDDFWLRQFGNDLQIDLAGTDSGVTMSAWFASPNQLQEITAGGLKLDTQVCQLERAMTVYSAGNIRSCFAAASAGVPHVAKARSRAA